jgi:pantoate--beta-alanine ligase
MKVLNKIGDLDSVDRSKSLGFVATMGALHSGHAKLVEESKNANQKTILSIFVNPTQFNNPKDFETYPNVLEKDLDFCKSLNVDYVFVPKVEDIYNKNESITLLEDEISKKFEGEHRPGHFSGVLAVVLKLLNIIQPDRAYFGEKDYQQYLLIKRLAENYFLKTKIVGVQIARDEKGLALSSRNLNLSDDGLKKAQSVAKEFLSTTCEKDFLSKVQKLDIELEYYGQDWDRILMAHYVDGVRLIDNKPSGRQL